MLGRKFAKKNQKKSFIVRMGPVEGWMDGRSKMSFNVLRTSWVYRACIYLQKNIQKLSPTFLWVSKFDVKLRVGVHHFRNYPRYVSFQIFGSKSRLFFLFEFSYFFLNLKNVIYYAKFNHKVRFWNTSTLGNFENHTR